MRGEKTVIWTIQLLQKEGFTVTITRPGEYPEAVAVKGKAKVRIDFDTGKIEGRVDKHAEEFVRATKFLFDDVKGKGKKVEGNIGGVLRLF